MFQHFRVSQQFRVLSAEMLHHLLNVVVGTHRCLKSLVSLEFCFSAQDILAGHDNRQQNKLQEVAGDGTAEQCEKRIVRENANKATNADNGKHIGRPHCTRISGERDGEPGIKALLRLLSRVQLVDIARLMPVWFVVKKYPAMA